MHQQKVQYFNLASHFITSQNWFFLICMTFIILQTFIAQPPGAWQCPWLQKDKISKSLTNWGRNVLCKQADTWNCWILNAKNTVQYVVHGNSDTRAASIPWKEGIHCGPVRFLRWKQKMCILPAHARHNLHSHFYIDMYERYLFWRTYGKHFKVEDLV